MRARLERLLSELKARIRGYPTLDWYRARGMQVGERVYLGRGSTFDTGFLQLISVGDETTISAGVEILAHDASPKRHVGYTMIARVTIGNRVYVGAGAIVLPGVTIGDGAVVGAGSVVTRDVAPGAVVAGNPAREISTVEALAEKHRQRMAERPTYPFHGWTLGGGITPERADRMRDELASGPGYVE
jgi:maltose O-acetyltransferase